MQKKVKVTALTSFAHGNVDAHKGGVYSIPAGEVDDLVKGGFVERVGDDAAPAAPAEDDASDLLGKAEAAPENKMEAAPENKSAKSKAK
jgi:hypothetical protein